METYQAPSPGQVNVAVDPNSKRLQLLQPFAAWNGKDIEVGLGATGDCWLLCVTLKWGVYLDYVVMQKYAWHQCHAFCCARLAKCLVLCMLRSELKHIHDQLENG